MNGLWDGWVCHVCRWRVKITINGRRRRNVNHSCEACCGDLSNEENVDDRNRRKGCKKMARNMEVENGNFLFKKEPERRKVKWLLQEKSDLAEK